MTAPEPEPEQQLDNTKSHLTSSYFYDDAAIFEESGARTEFDTNFKLTRVLGFDLTRRYNALPINESTLLITSGNFSFVLDLVTQSEQIILGHNEGVPCAAVHPNTEYLAIGEMGSNPKILIYQFPSLKLYRVLNHGTESAFSTLNFSPDGKMLAAVGAYPDYTLTVWDWERETLILRAKAFSQDVYRVAFSRSLEGRLVTSGMGHIRIWNMAKTFTGLKLQGEIGKFGNIEISDTAGFEILPDGKVVSGAESGSLLLWEDALVKCEFSRTGGKKCHNGMVEAVYHKGSEIVTAGRDGVIRVWDFNSIDTAETDDTAVTVDLTQKAKLRVSKDGSIRSMHPIGPSYIVVDASGGIYRANVENHRSEPLAKFHAGSITALEFYESLLLSGGVDGYVRVWDVLTGLPVAERHFPSGVSIIKCNEGQFYVGFDDGTLRVLEVGNNKISLVQPLKPHTSSIRDIQFQNGMMATTSDDGALFIYKLVPEVTPLGFVNVDGRKPLSKEEITAAAVAGVPLPEEEPHPAGLKIRWGEAISVECSDGTVASLVLPSSYPSDTSESYWIDAPIEKVGSVTIEQDVTVSLSGEYGDIKGLSNGKVVINGYERVLHSAPVSSIAICESCLATASSNGELFLFTKTAAGRIKPAVLKTVVEEKVEDIKPGEYSIEEEKQKSELDRRIKAAEGKKSIVRQKIEGLRQRFSALVAKNTRAPLYLQVPPEAMRIDPFLYELAEETSKTLEQEAREQTERDAERSKVALRKIKKWLMREVKEAPETIKGLNVTTEVCSFRISDVDILETLSESAPKEVTEEAVQQSQQEKTVSEEKAAQSEPSQTRKIGRFGRMKPLKKTVHTADEHAEKRRKRDERKKAVLAARPTNSAADPADDKEIEEAKKSFGDYKLKDDQSYIAPEEERMDAKKKRMQLITLQRAIYDMKVRFNEKLSHLSNLRKEVVKFVNSTNRELESIRASIGGPIDRVNIRFGEIEVDDKSLRKPSPEAVILADAAAAAGRRRIEARAGKAKQQTATHRQSKRKQATTIRRKVSQTVEVSEIETLEKTDIAAELNWRREILHKRVSAVIADFDDRLEKLAVEKGKVSTSIVLSELRAVLLLREFKLLARLELKDRELHETLRKRKADIAALDSELNEKERMIKSLEAKAEEGSRELRKLQKRFDGLVDPAFKFHDQLSRIFSYNIRRDRTAAGDEDVDLTSLDIEQLKKLLDAQNIEKEEDACPPGCDPSLFERVLDLREAKMDASDSIAQSNSEREAIKHEVDSILFKRKTLDASLKQITQEFEDFQHEKQRHLNELNFSLTLGFGQIEDVKAIGGDMKNSIVFTHKGLARLHQREAELRNDRLKALNRLRIEQTRNKENLKQKETLEAKLNEKVKELEDLQDLKFGQKVDLVEIEQLRVDVEADSLTAQIKEVEERQNAELSELTDQIEECQRELTAEIQRNTAVLGNLVKLTESQREIETVLQGSRQSQENETSQEAEAAQPTELLQMVERNNELIDRLREERDLLKRR